MRNPHGPDRKQCRKCEVVKPIGEFRAKTAVCNACKRKQQDAYNDSHRDSINASSRRYYSRNADLINQKQVERYQRQSERWAAHKRVAKALRDGQLKRERCQHCGRKDVHAHHRDYSKPLEVIWLCPKCHRQEHKNAA